MGQQGSSHRRTRPSSIAGRETKERLRIAQTAARLIAEHGIADWNAAKRKAARQLMLPECVALPDDDELTTALAEYHALFGGEAHALRLRGQRELAVQWMRRLSEFAPVLSGGVAEGWATEHSDVRLELTAADAKLVEIFLLSAGVSYRTMRADRDGAAELYIDTPDCGIRLSVRTPADARQRPRRDRHGHDEVRLDIDAVLALLR